MFAAHGGIVAGIYTGESIDSVSAVDSLIVQAESAEISDTFAAQICGTTYDGSHTVGIVVNTRGDYATVQSAIQTWVGSSCVTGYDSVVTRNITIEQFPVAVHSAEQREIQFSERDDTCSYVLVESGDSCASLEEECGITDAEFTEYNPSDDLCSTLTPGEAVCCSSGSLPDLSPQENADGTCYNYTIQKGDYCALLASEYYITTDDIETWNSETWGWMGCDDLQLDAIICLSTGDPPMPAVLATAECGPQVSGTQRPSNWSDIGLLNPCPLNACCDIWGECGITSLYCTASESTTGAPGTAANGSNGCISNCGTDIVNNDDGPAELMRIGYFEAFGANRSCLNMDASQLPSSYSHIHYAFGEISDDYQVDVSTYLDQFETFANITTSKRILSFGGWSFSTDADSYAIFRNTVTEAERTTFANSVVSFVDEYDLDGVDFDWEYPGATDIPGIPAGSTSDGPNYLAFLQTLRGLLADSKSISIAAPASYWYLKNFPIANISEVVDYIVYMTYDLHGQWDYNSSYANPGCPTGNCLRSHVNLTETEYALSMITKAGVPANKVVVGIASYGRSFGMEDSSCTGPECLFTGPDSTASPGNCTDTAGYISQAELDQYSSGTTDGTLARRAVTTWHDNSSDSDLMTYGDQTWVAYMSDDTKATRINLYSSYNFAGSVEWAVDLTNFVQSVADEEASENITALEDDFTAALSISDYDISNFTAYNLTDLATRLVGWEGCEYNEDTFPILHPQRIIYSGWQQSWKIMNYMYNVAKSGINFNEAAAVEYLGPPALVSSTQQTSFNNIFKNLATIQPGWGGWFAWKLHVRCDDPENLCPCGVGPIAYTTNKDADSGLARINFCQQYFYLQTLDDKMVFATTSFPVETYANVANYLQNQATVWIHELLHIDWVSTASTDANIAHVTDVKIQARFKSGKEWVKVYGAAMAKILGRLGHNTGGWTMKNADSITLYGFAKYIQNALGNIYPHLPLASQSPTGISTGNGDVVFSAEDLFTVYDNGTIIESSNTTLLDEYSWSTTQGVCAKADDEDGDLDSSDILTIGTDFAVQSDFPSAYLSSWSSWAGLATTTATATSTSAAASATATWTIAVYSDTDCSGDYYSLEGHNVDSTTDSCLVLRGGDLGTGVTGAGVSCRWFTDGGETWADCGTSTLTQPKSWRVKGGTCTAYDTDDCSSDGYEDAYTSAQGCHNYESSLDDTETWVALQCGADPVATHRQWYRSDGDKWGDSSCVCVYVCVFPANDDVHDVEYFPAIVACYHGCEKLSLASFGLVWGPLGVDETEALLWNQQL
ncbi:Killer toxin subunits alpha/beta [Cytospora mali]|uniref:chitinase n=1 Tax=Cytospora mali TaxID=578113 RepID=A0A194V9W6_CYTMA|nr:Killer toxin subunits alpha/beta [Valsa mali var. pyri (nom. inval.)]